MFDDLQLVAILKSGPSFELRRIPLHQTLQQELISDWQQQHAAFMADAVEIPFNAGYEPEEHERFVLEPYLLPGWLSGDDDHSVASLPELALGEIATVRGIVAFVHAAKAGRLRLFQSFNRARVIQPGRFLFLQGNTYTTSDRPALMLDRKLSAIYFPSQQRLLFHSFRVTNAFLPLADFYQEASDDQIREVLEHALLAAENIDAVATGASQWTRKRFSMLRDSGVLDQFTARQIKQRSEGYGLALQLKNGRIVYPADKQAGKKVLQFLNEELYRGAITETLYETNSKRPTD